MKRLFATIFCLILMLSTIIPASASEADNVIWQQEISLDNGITVIDEVIDQTIARSSTSCDKNGNISYT